MRPPKVHFCLSTCTDSPAASAALAPSASVNATAAKPLLRKNVFIRSSSPASLALFGRGGGARERRTALTAQHRLGDGPRHLSWRLQHSHDRHDHEEVEEVVDREEACPVDVGALRRLGAEIAERQ